MAANTYNNVAAITRAAMNVLTNNLQLPKLVNRTYEQEWDAHGAQIGDTTNVRIPGLGTYVTGKTASPSAYYDSYVPVTLTQKNSSLKFSSKELALNVEEGGEFERSVLGPQMAALLNGIEVDGFALYSQIPHSIGTPGTAPTDLTYFLQGKATLSNFAAPFDDNISCLYDPWTGASVINGLKGLFQDASQIGKQYTKGMMGLAAGATWYESQNVPWHTVGALPGTVLTNYGSPAAEGMTTLAIDGITSGQGSLKVGDILTVTGVNSVNPVSKADTGQLMQLVVTEAITDTTGAMTVKISPALYSTGAKQNVTALPLDGKSVKIFGAADTYSGKVSPANLIFHKDAFAFVCRDLPKTAPAESQHRVRNRDLGVSIRVSQYWDGVNDDLLYRMDILTGWAVLRPDFAVRIQG